MASNQESAVSMKITISSSLEPQGHRVVRCCHMSPLRMVVTLSDGWWLKHWSSYNWLESYSLHVYTGGGCVHWFFLLFETLSKWVCINKQPLPWLLMKCHQVHYKRACLYCKTVLHQHIWRINPLKELALQSAWDWVLCSICTVLIHSTILSLV